MLTLLRNRCLCSSCIQRMHTQLQEAFLSIWGFSSKGTPVT